MKNDNEPKTDPEAKAKSGGKDEPTIKVKVLKTITKHRGMTHYADAETKMTEQEAKQYEKDDQIVRI